MKFSQMSSNFFSVRSFDWIVLSQLKSTASNKRLSEDDRTKEQSSKKHWHTNESEKSRIAVIAREEKRDISLSFEDMSLLTFSKTVTRKNNFENMHMQWHERNSESAIITVLKTRTCDNTKKQWVCYNNSFEDTHMRWHERTVSLL